MTLSPLSMHSLTCSDPDLGMVYSKPQLVGLKPTDPVQFLATDEGVARLDVSNSSRA